MKNLRKSLWCVCVPQWPWVELQLINSIDDVALALLFFCSQHRAWTWESHLPSLKEEEGGRTSRLCSVFTGEGGGVSHLPLLFFIHHSFATFMWSTGWKFNLMTCLQARNMILKPVTVKQRCYLHNDPSKIGLQPLPWQLVDKQKNGGRALMMGGRVVGWAADCTEKRPRLQSWRSWALAHWTLLFTGWQSSSNGIDHWSEAFYLQGHYGL